MKHSALIAALACLALAACKADRSEPDPDSTPGETPSVAPTQSIFGPEAGIEPEPETLEPLNTVIGFGEGGADLSEEALAELATVRASPQVKAGGPIVLRGHSDAAGSDEVNLRASQQRAEAVRDWLVEQGVPEDRITIIAFGEQNPIEPNALPDGEPNEQGRAANRRVEIEVRTDALTPAPGDGENRASSQDDAAD